MSLLLPLSRQREVAEPRRAAPTSSGASVQYYREIVSELRKVIWPGRHELVTYSVVVLVFVVCRDRLRGDPGLRAHQSGAGHFG